MLGTIFHFIVSASLGFFAGACLMVGAIDILDSWGSGILRSLKTVAVVAVLVGAVFWLANIPEVFLLAGAVLVIWCAWSMFQNKISDEKPEGSA